MDHKPRFAILGAGNGGLSMAGDLVLHGFEVCGLYDRFPEPIAPVKDRGGIRLVGEVLEGFAPVANATTDIAEAVNGADVIAVVTPTLAHEWIAEHLAPHLQDGQVILLTPGYPGGTLLFRKTLHACGARARVDLAETNLILYATRIVGPAEVGIWAIKKTLWIAALPASRTEHVLKVLHPAVPQLEPLRNVLEVGLNSHNPVEHVPTVLLNLGMVDMDDGSRHFDLHEWMTPSIARVQEAMDAERARLLKAMGLRYFSLAEASFAAYQGEKWRIVPMRGAVPESSKTIPPRYIAEDVSMGLVAWESMARKLGLETPVLGTMINLANLVKRADFRKQGRTLEKLGLAEMSIGEILAMVDA